LTSGVKPFGGRVQFLKTEGKQGDPLVRQADMGIGTGEKAFLKYPAPHGARYLCQFVFDIFHGRQ